jgi:hypothetical protein
LSLARYLLLLLTTIHGALSVSVSCLEHHFLGLGVGVPLVQRLNIGRESFHCRTGSTWRIANRVRCSAGDTENQNLVRLMPSLTNMSSNCGARRRNSACSCGVPNPITFSTPARLHQDRSNNTISPRPGRCAT